MKSFKSIIRYILYIVSIPLIVLGSFSLFVNHPEVQLAFWVPGVVLIVYSLIRDDLFNRFRLIKGK